MVLAHSFFWSMYSRPHYRQDSPVELMTKIVSTVIGHDSSKAIIQLGALFSFLAAQAGLAQVRSLGNLPDTFVFLLFRLTVPLGLAPSRSLGRLALLTFLS